MNETPPVTVTRRVHFNAAHRLHNPDLSEAENRELFGLCNNPNFHGHNYELDVSVSGPIDPRTGYVADLAVIRNIVEERIVTYLDHKNLNLDVPDFASLNPTAENIAQVIWQRLADHLPARLTRIVLWETPRNKVEIVS